MLEYLSGSLIVGRLIKLIGVKFVFLFGASFLMLGGLIIACVSADELKSFMGSFCAIAFIFGTLNSLNKFHDAMIKFFLYLLTVI